MGIGGIGGAGDADFDELRGAFAVAHDLLREVEHHPTERGLEFARDLAPEIGDGFGLRHAGRCDDQRVRGGRVAVHRDRVEWVASVKM